MKGEVGKTAGNFLGRLEESNVPPHKTNPHRRTEMKDSRRVYEKGFQICENFKWFDYRVVRPSSNSFCFYIIIENCGGYPVRNIAGYTPKNDYTEGEFVSTNNYDYSLDKYVLYWAPLPATPKIIDSLCNTGRV